MRALRRGGVCAWGGRGSAPSRGFLEPRRLAVHRQEHAVEQDERHHDPVEPRIPYQRYAQPSRGMLLSEYPQRFLGQLLRRSWVKGARASRSVDRVPSFMRWRGRSMIVFRRGAAFGARGGRVGSRRGRTIGPRPVKIVDTRVPHADSQCARGGRGDIWRTAGDAHLEFHLSLNRRGIYVHQGRSRRRGTPLPALRRRHVAPRARSPSTTGALQR